MIRVAFLPSGVSAQAEPGDRLLDLARRAGAPLNAECGGRGRCGGCLVALDAAAAEALEPPTSEELGLLPPGPPGEIFRLACLARVRKDLTVRIPPESTPSTAAPRKPFTKHQIRIRPAVAQVTLELPPEGPGDETPDERIRAALHAAPGRASSPGLEVLADFSRQPGADGASTVTATLFRGLDVIRLRPGAARRLLGVALDVGTTTLVAFLCDLAADKILAVRSGPNPQAAYGEDVVSRIAAVQKDPGKLDELRWLAVRELNALLADAAREVAVDLDDVVDVVAVGNPTMQHLLVGLNPVPIGRAPYTPICRHPGEVSAGAIGLAVYPGARVHIFPMPSGFIGGDTVAALLTRGPGFFRGTNLLVDVGTNGEVVLARDGELTATSCATGPAFEGAHIRSGMRASPGAVEKVRVGPSGELLLDLIGGESRLRPAGLCGSGVISAVAALARAGILREDGAFETEGDHPSVRTDAGTGVAEIVLVPASESRSGRDVVLTQWDVRAVQLGKGALRAGIELLLEDARVERLDGVYLAGTFGTYLDPDDILRIGMLPPLEVDRIHSIGNAAGDGARLALFSTEYRKRAARLAERVRVVELSNRPEFSDLFVASMGLKADLDG